MKNESLDEVPAKPASQEDRQLRRNLGRALGFGVVMATVEMGVLLYFMYC